MSSIQPAVNVLFFARHREQMGMAECVVSIATPLTLGALKQQLTEQHPQFATLHQPIMAAINQDFADDDRLVQQGDEVAFFPPVTGG